MSPVYTEKEGDPWDEDGWFPFWQYSSAYGSTDKWTELRMRFLLSLFIVVFCLIVGRLYYLQILEGSKLKALAVKQYAFSPTPEMPAAIDVSDIKNDVSIFSVHNYYKFLVQTFKNNRFTIDIVGAITILIGVAQVILAYYPIRRDLRAKKIMAVDLTRRFFDKETIHRATRYYVRTKCTSYDPSCYDEISKFPAEESEDLFNTVDNVIKTFRNNKFFLILADSGMGKTTFVLNYYIYNLCKHRKLQYKIEVVPLIHKDCDEYILSISDKDNTVLFLDGFDEDVKAISDYEQRFKELSRLCSGFMAVIMTCRTQFFHTDEDIPKGTGISKVGPRSLCENSIYNLSSIYIAPFDDNDVTTFLRKCYNFKAKRAKQIACQIAEKIPYLKVRPLLLTYIPEIVKQNTRASNAAQIYEIMVNGWLEREAKDNEKQELQNFSEDLAVNFYVGEELRDVYGIHYEELSDLTSKLDLLIDSDKVTGRSLLNRNSDGFYKFAHRSIMEFLVVKQLVKGNKSCCNIPLTDLMRRFFVETVCTQWPLSESVITSLCNLRFQVSHNDNYEGAFHTKQEVTLSLYSLLKARNLLTPAQISALFDFKEVSKFTSNQSLILLCRDLSLCLVSYDEGSIIYDYRRDDAFWLEKTTYSLKQNAVPIGLSAIPPREQVGVIAFINYFGSKIGYDLLYLVLNLSQNEMIMSQGTTKDSFIIKFNPITQTQENEDTLVSQPSFD